MMQKLFHLRFIVTLLVVFTFNAHSETGSDPDAEATAETETKTYKELNWQDLMPEGWIPEPTATPEMVHSFDFAEQMKEFFRPDPPVVEALNETLVKVPGFIIPLEFDEVSISEFLLVPYMGACIHTPPPPGNQMVFVKLQEPMSSGNLWDPVWASGKILTKKEVTEFATPSYTLVDATVSLYTF